MMLSRYLLLISIVGFSHAYASDWDYSGHAKLLLNHTQYQADDLAAVIADQNNFSDLNSNLRLNLQRQWQSWDLNIHYQLAGMSGDSTAISGSASSDDGSLFNLASVISGDGYQRWLHRLDRLNLGYAADDWVMRIGRQAISWGNGINFHPLDIFNPFSPLSLDTEYKNGDDLLYMQWLVNSNTDLQFIYLPRRDKSSGLLDSDQDSLALKMHMMSEGGDWDVLVARHFNDTVYGLAYVRNVAGAVWRNDINMTRLSDGRTAWFIDTNMDYSWNWFRHNFYGYIEWFHNSLGQSVVDIPTADQSLKERLERGEVYSLANNLISLGTMMEINPRWQANLNLLYQPDDKGYLLNMMLNYDWQQDATLIMGLRLPGGPRGSEYGGLYTTVPDTGFAGFNSAGTQLFLYIQYYY